MSDTWTIGELAERAADALRAHAQPLNGRVREVPGERLIRWYTTIGLVDPPLTRRGRIARYGRRHLLQLVAVKRLQAEGMSIADIQAALTGAEDAALEAAARLPGAPDPAEAPRPAAPPVAYQGDGQPAPRARFWADRPVPEADRSVGKADRSVGKADRPVLKADTSVPKADRSVPEVDRPVPEAVREGGREAPGAVHGVRLAAGVMLVLDGTGRVPADDDVRAVLAAAGPLLAVLEERGLT
ncbi:helix-turn-helix domain-containing protein [Nonomuraea sp. NPDC048826]|uniref:helix-turn-helix domain-containing protein n=1 Tax=Nonomuraea sp. NPDC048826 TaxID=3364347 RepID=UPI003720B691